MSWELDDENSREGYHGRIDELSGTVIVHRRGDTFEPKTGTELFVGDELETGNDGSVNWVSRGEPRSLGPTRRIKIGRLRQPPLGERQSPEWEEE